MIASLERRPAISMIGAWLLLVSCLAPAAQAMTVGLFTVFSPIRFEDILPADCLIFGTIDCDKEGGEKLAIRRLLDEPEVKAFAGSVTDRARGIQSLINKIWTDPKTNAGLSQVSRIGFSLGGVRSVSASGREEPSLVLAVEIGGDKKGFLEALAHLRDMAAQGLGSGRTTTVREKRHTYAGQEITEVSFGAGAGDLQVAYTLIDSLFVAAPDPISVQSLVDNYKSPPKSPLSRLDTFLKSRERAGGDDARLLVFFNLRAFRETYLDHLSAEECSSWKALGLGDVDGVCYSIGFEGTAFEERIFVHTPKPAPGWLTGVVTPKTDDFRSLDLVSGDSAYYSAWKGDWSRCLGEVESAMAALEPASVEVLRGWEAEFERITGQDLRQDFLASLGEEVSISALIQPGTLVPYALVTVEIADKKKFDGALESILAAAGLDLAPFSMPGTGAERIRQIVPKRSSEAATANPLAMMAAFGGLLPAVLQEGDTFLLASHPILLTSVVAAGGKSVANPIRRHPDVMAAMEEVGPKANSIELVDLRRIFNLLYGMAIPVILSAPSDSLPFDSALLPTAESIARHLSTATMTSRTDADGFLWRCVSPLPFGAVALGALVAAAVVVTGTSVEAVPEPPVVAEPTRPLPPGAPGEPGTSVAMLERNARRYELAGNIGRAIETMDRAVEMAPTSGGLRFTRGYMKINEAKIRGADKEQLASAREDFHAAIRLGFNTADAQYNVACTFALEGRKDEAFAALRKSLEMGFNKLRLLRSDPDLANLRGDARFAGIVREIEAGEFAPKSDKR